MNQNSDWTKNPLLSRIDPAKLQLLQSLAAEGSQKGRNDIASFLTAAAATSKEKGMQFSQDEIAAVIEVMKIGKSPAEAARIDQMIAMIRMLKKS